MDVRSIPLAELLEPLYPARQVADDDKMRELVRSIATQGLLHPLVVTAEDGRYRILAGHRRFIAVRGLGWQDVPCNVLELNGRHGEDITIEENLVREDVNPLDLGYFLKHMQDTEGLTQRELGLRYGHSAMWANYYLQLTKLDDETQAAVQEKTLPAGAALELQRITNEELRKALTREAVVREQSATMVKQTVEQYVRNERTVNQAVEAAQAVREEQRVSHDGLRCIGCGTLAIERSGDMVWLCAGCQRAIVEAQTRETAGEG